jgi:pheromone shutdown protein TraB
MMANGGKEMDQDEELRVLAVVGLGHLDGIEHHWNDVEKKAVETRIPWFDLMINKIGEISRIPGQNITTKQLRYVCFSFFTYLCYHCLLYHARSHFIGNC